MKHIWYHDKRYDIIYDNRYDIKFLFHMILSLYMIWLISYIYLWYHRQYHIHDIMHDIAVWYCATDFMILQMISYSISYDIMCTSKFNDIIENCMISYMILNMISIFHIIWCLSTTKYLWYHSFDYDDYDTICNIISMISYIWYYIGYTMTSN